MSATVTFDLCEDFRGIKGGHITFNAVVDV